MRNFVKSMFAPMVLLVDTSVSILKCSVTDEVNSGLKEFYEGLSRDYLINGRADILIVPFGSDVNVKIGFSSVDLCSAPVFSSDGPASMNQALLLALSEIQKRKDLYRSQGFKWCKACLFLLTDGLTANDGYQSEAVNEVRKAIEDKKIKYVPVGIGSADIKQLQKYYPENYDQKIVLKADAKSFANLFSYLLIDDNDFPEPDDSLKLPITPSDIKLPEVPPDIIIDL